MSIYDVINIYEVHTQYKEKKISITRALDHYTRINNHFELITDLEIKKIKNIYKDYLINNNLPIDEEVENEIESDYEKKKPSDFSDTDSESSESNENNINENKDNNSQNSNGLDDNNLNNKGNFKKSDIGKDNKKNEKNVKTNISKNNNIKNNKKENNDSTYNEFSFYNNYQNLKTKKKNRLVHYSENENENENEFYIKKHIPSIIEKLDNCKLYSEDRIIHKLELRHQNINSILFAKRKFEYNI